MCADETKFKAAIAIVANNDLKHEICKVRAAAYARRTKQRIVWSPATDYATVECLSSDPELMKKKKNGCSYITESVLVCGGWCL